MLVVVVFLWLLVFVQASRDNLQLLKSDPYCAGTYRTWKTPAEGGIYFVYYWAHTVFALIYCPLSHNPSPLPPPRPPQKLLFLKWYKSHNWACFERRCQCMGHRWSGWILLNATPPPLPPQPISATTPHYPPYTSPARSAGSLAFLQMAILAGRCIIPFIFRLSIRS